MGTLPEDGATLSRQMLNRTLLARQMLLQRQTRPVVETIEHLVGMQSQVPTNPYVALWSRLTNFGTDELSRMVVERKVVRASLMRATLHLVTARDCLTLYPLLSPVLARTFKNTPFGKGTQHLKPAPLLNRARTLLDEQPRTLKDLGALLHQQWPDYEPSHLAQAVHHLLPLVQVPPRGTWGASHKATWATIENWLGRPFDPEPELDALVLRYLAAFGPATAADVSTWSGLTGLREVLTRLRPQLRIFRDERGRELFDIPEAPWPEPDSDAPPRFLPEYDNILLSHADRTRVMSDDNRKRLMTRNAVLPGSFLLDGYLQGTWKIERTRNAARLLLRPYSPVPGDQQAALFDEGAQLLALMAADTTERDMEIVADESQRSLIRNTHVTIADALSHL